MKRQPGVHYDAEGQILWTDYPCDPRREAEEEELFATGDPRRCPRHPNIATSSPDGMFDAPCGECEYECSVLAERRRYESPTRPIGFCAPPAHYWGWPPGWRGLITCVDTVDDLPF